MVIIKNFKTYTPDNKELLALGVSFLISGEGKDWYAAQKDFKKDTLKVAYDPETKVLRMASYDVSYFFPQGMSVAETTTLVKGFSIDGDLSKFCFDEEKISVVDRIYSQDEKKQSADNKKVNLIAEAVNAINPLQYAVDLVMATEEENTRLKKLQKYVVLLNRISSQEGYPDSVEWPEKPE